jgi:hypothetical protein
MQDKREIQRVTLINYARCAKAYGEWRSAPGHDGQTEWRLLEALACNSGFDIESGVSIASFIDGLRDEALGMTV